MIRPAIVDRDARFRLGIIGHGMWPSTYLIPGARQVDDVDVVAVCGRDSARAADFADAHGIERSYDSIDRMLTVEDFDGVIIANPPPHHESAVRAVSGFRAAVLCEKPLALEADSARRIRDLLVDRPALTGFTLRWQPLFQQLREAVVTQAVGAVRHVRIRYLQSSAATPARGWDWHFDAADEPLGVISDLGPHAIDLVRWMVGDVTEVSAFARTTIGERMDADSGRLRAVTNHDDADVQLTAQSGATVSLTISRVAPDAGVPGGITVEVLAEEGWIRVDSNEADVVIGTASGVERRPVAAMSLSSGSGAQIRDFVRVARGEHVDGLPSVDDGYQAQLVMDAVARSLDAGGTVLVRA